VDDNDLHLCAKMYPDLHAFIVAVETFIERSLTRRERRHALQVHRRVQEQ
jgi:hypothetical protein